MTAADRIRNTAGVLPIVGIPERHLDMLILNTHSSGDDNPTAAQNSVSGESTLTALAAIASFR